MEENAVNVPLEAEADDVLSFADAELTTLKSIYIDEIEVTHEVDKKSTSVSINLHPATADNIEKQYVKMNLKFTLNEKYPTDVPDISICNPRGLSDEKLNSIAQELKSVAEERKGNSMLFEIIATAKELLTVENKPCGECAVCLYGFSDEDVFTKTECYHYFHSHCLARYAKNLSAEEIEDEQKTNPDETAQKKELLCPVCRLPIQFDGSSDTFPPPLAADEECVISEKVLEVQEKMADMFQKQLEKGGIIDIEEEKNRYLLEISNVPTRINTAQDEVSDDIPAAEDTSEPLLKDKTDIDKETAENSKSTVSSPEGKERDDRRPKYSNLAHARNKKYERNTNPKTGRSEEKAGSQKDSIGDSKDRYDGYGQKFANDRRYNNYGHNRRYNNENYGRENSYRYYQLRGGSRGRGRYAQNGYRNYHDQGNYGRRRTYSDREARYEDSSTKNSKSLAKNTSESNSEEKKESAEHRKDLESDPIVNNCTEESLEKEKAQGTNSTNDEVSHEKEDQHSFVKDVKHDYSDRGKGRNQNRFSDYHSSSNRGRGGYPRGNSFARNNQRGYRENRNWNSYSRNRNQDISESGNQLEKSEAQSNSKGDRNKINFVHQNQDAEGQNRESNQRNSNFPEESKFDDIKEKNDIDVTRRYRNHSFNAQAPRGRYGERYREENRGNSRRESNREQHENVEDGDNRGHSYKDNNRERYGNAEDRDNRGDSRRDYNKERNENVEDRDNKGSSRRDYNRERYENVVDRDSKGNTRKDYNREHEDGVGGDNRGNCRGEYNRERHENMDKNRGNSRRDYNREHENGVSGDTRYRNNFRPQTHQPYHKSNQKYNDDRPLFNRRGSNSYQYKRGSRQHNGDASRQNGNEYDGGGDKESHGKPSDLPSEQPPSPKENVPEPSKDVPIDSTLKPASSAPQMLGPQMPPPGFSDRRKKVVYGLIAAPPGFPRS